MAKVLIDENLYDADFVSRQAEGFDGFQAVVSGVRLDDIENATGLPLEAVRDAVRRLAAAPRAMAFFAAGVSGLDRDTAALIFDLFLAAGKIGREGCGVNPVTGISNILGASDMGASPGLLPGFEAMPGRRIDELLQSSPSPLKALVVVDHDEEINLSADRIEALEFVVYLGSYANPFTELAHVVLPTASYGETDGTYTNTERRIQLNRRKLEPRFESRPGWRIFADIAARRGQDWGYRSAGDVFADIARTVPHYAAVTYEKLEKSFGGLQWPCDASHPQGTPRLRAEEAGRLRFVPLEAGFGGPAPVSDYPMSLIAGKSYYYWHQNNIMKKTFIPRREYNALLLLYPQGLVEIHPEDAARIGIRDKRPVRVVSAQASMDLAARVTEDVRPGMAYVPYFIGPMVPGFLKPHAALVERGEDAVIPVRIEKV
jgi:formate dehydrogenase major subunit